MTLHGCTSSLGREGQECDTGSDQNPSKQQSDLVTRAWPPEHPRSKQKDSFLYDELEGPALGKPGAQSANTDPGLFRQI